MAFSHLSHSPLQGVKGDRFLTDLPTEAFSKAGKITPPLLNSSFPGKRSLGLLHSSWHTLPQTCNCCRLRGQSLGEESPSISGLTIWPLLSVGPFFSMPRTLSLQAILSSLQHRHPLFFPVIPPRITFLSSKVEGIFQPTAGVFQAKRQTMHLPLCTKG